MIAELTGVALSPIRIGDGPRTARGWLVVAHGAVRAILSAGDDGQIIHAFACDRRVVPEDGMMIFVDLDEAHAWFEKRLPFRPRGPRRERVCRALDEDTEATSLTRAEAEQALIGAAMDYCWSVRNRSLPEEGPLRRLWTAYVGYRRAGATGATNP
jgi:hypothetical protein